MVATNNHLYLRLIITPLTNCHESPTLQISRAQRDIDGDRKISMPAPRQHDGADQLIEDEEWAAAADRKTSAPAPY